MNSRICRCCGELMPDKGNTLSRNPNICASCSSMADGMEEPVATESRVVSSGGELKPERAEATAPERLEERAAEPAAHHAPI